MRNLYLDEWLAAERRAALLAIATAEEANMVSTMVGGPVQAERRTRLPLWAGVLAPVLFAAVFTLDGVFRPGYSAYNEAISYLDLGASGWIQRANFMLFGLLLMVFAAGYFQPRRAILPATWRAVVTAFLVLSDLGWIMAGLFVPDPYLAPQTSWHAILHQVASIIVFLPFAIASLVSGVALVSTRGWRLYGAYCVILGLIQAIFPLGTTLYFFNPGIVGNVNSPGSGLFQRVAILLGPIAWYMLLGCIMLARRSGSAADGSTSPVSALADAGTSIARTRA